jgi:ATP synthase protein I
MKKSMNKAPENFPNKTKAQKDGHGVKGSEADRLEQDTGLKNNTGLGMAMRLGTELVVATMIGVGTGYWLDSQFDTQPWLLILFLVFGAAAGFKNVYRIVQPVVDISGSIDENKEEK